MDPSPASSSYPTLPQLHTSNYSFWYFAIKNHAETLEAPDHLSSNPPEPTDPAQKKQHTQKKTKLTTAILSSVPPNILGQIFVPDDDPTPHDLVSRILTHINQSTKEDHQFLKTEAESIHFKSDTKISDYIQQHKEVRQRMLAARYPNITDETTTVEFLIEGLKRNATLSNIVFQFLANKPKDIKDFTRKFKELYGFSQTMAPSPTRQSSSGFTGDYGPTNTTPYNRQQYTPRQRRVFTGKPCQFHLSLGIMPQHTDHECRDRRHPKNNTPRPQANYAQTWPYQQIQYQQYPTQLPPAPGFTFRHNTTPPPPPVDVTSEADTDTTGTFMLDSGAHPTHLTRPTQQMKPLTNTQLEPTSVPIHADQ